MYQSVRPYSDTPFRARKTKKTKSKKKQNKKNKYKKNIKPPDKASTAIKPMTDSLLGSRSNPFMTLSLLNHILQNQYMPICNCHGDDIRKHHRKTSPPPLAFFIEFIFFFFLQGYHHSIRWMVALALRKIFKNEGLPSQELREKKNRPPRSLPLKYD